MHPVSRGRKFEASTKKYFRGIFGVFDVSQLIQDEDVSDVHAAKSRLRVAAT